MTYTTQVDPQRSSRWPDIGGAAFLLLLSVVGFIFLLPKLRHRDELRVEAQTAVGPPVVLAARLKAGEGGGHLEISASVQAFDQTPIFARTSGYVKARYVDIGPQVRQGQLLAVIEDPQTAQALMQANATVAQLKAQLAQAQANSVLSTVTHHRWLSLVASGVVSLQAPVTST